MSIFKWLPKPKAEKKPVEPEAEVDKNLKIKEKEIETVKTEAQQKLTKIAKEMKTKHTADEVYFKKTIREIHAVADSIAESAGRISQ